MTPCESDPEFWYTAATATEAERLCVTACPRLAECQQEWAALPPRQQPYGVWAGVDRASQSRTLRQVTCAECGRVKAHEAKGLCRPCYRNRHKRERRRAA